MKYLSKGIKLLGHVVSLLTRISTICGLVLMQHKIMRRGSFPLAGEVTDSRIQEQMISANDEVQQIVICARSKWHVDFESQGHLDAFLFVE